MILSAPFIITPRLMAGLQLGEPGTPDAREILGKPNTLGWISIGYAPARSADNRTVYQVYFDLPGGAEFEDNTLRSGCGGGTLQSGMADLLSFLLSAVESRQYRERCTSTPDPNEDSNEGLFPPAVVDWACAHADDISMLQMEIEETPDLIRE